MHTVIAELLERVQSGRPLIQMSRWDEPKRFPTASSDQIAAAESRLGFVLPELLRQIYTSVGNGGFGPGYGLMGIEGGATDDLGHTIEPLYEGYRKSRPRRDSERGWPEYLLPCCHAGCAIYFCIDCADPESPVQYFEPNLQGTGPFGCELGLESETLEAWVQTWLRDEAD